MIRFETRAKLDELPDFQLKSQQFFRKKRSSRRWYFSWFESCPAA